MSFILTERQALKVRNLLLFRKKPISLQDCLTGSRISVGVSVHGEPSLSLGTRLGLRDTVFQKSELFSYSAITSSFEEYHL